MVSLPDLYLVSFPVLYLVSFPVLSFLQANYARQDPACVHRVKALYRELQLEEAYRQYEEESYQRLVGMIDRGAGSLPRGMFLEFAGRIYKRKN